MLHQGVQGRQGMLSASLLHGSQGCAAICRGLIPLASHINTGYHLYWLTVIVPQLFLIKQRLRPGVLHSW